MRLSRRFTAQAAGTAAGDPSAIAALEAAAGLYAAAFAGARVTPANAMTAGLTPDCRALIARDMIRRGESVHAIGVEGGMVRLAPVGSWDVRGGPDERDWWYRVDVFGPSGNLTHFVPSRGPSYMRATRRTRPAPGRHRAARLGARYGHAGGESRNPSRRGSGRAGRASSPDTGRRRRRRRR